MPAKRRPAARAASLTGGDAQATRSAAPTPTKPKSTVKKSTALATGKSEGTAKRRGRPPTKRSSAEGIGGADEEEKKRLAEEANAA